jgi:hypothetical protein
MIVSPNPNIGSETQIQFLSKAGRVHNLFAINQFTGQTYHLLNDYQAIDGDNTVVLSTQSLSAGSYFFRLSGDLYIATASFIKH